MSEQNAHAELAEAIRKAFAEYFGKFPRDDESAGSGAFAGATSAALATLWIAADATGMDRRHFLKTIQDAAFAVSQKPYTRGTA